MLADIEDPPHSIWPGLLKGFLIAAPIIGTIAYFALPSAYSMIMQGAASTDQRVALEGNYMQEVCSSAMVLARDESMCKCALASEDPGIDCQAPFLRWTIARQGEQCMNPELHAESLGFCSCVETIVGDIAALDPGPESTTERAGLMSNYRNCAKLGDSMQLPEIEMLAFPRKVCKGKRSTQGFEAYCECQRALESELKQLPDAGEEADARRGVTDRYSACYQPLLDAIAVAKAIPDAAPVTTTTVESATNSIDTNSNVAATTTAQ